MDLDAFRASVDRWLDEQKKAAKDPVYLPADVREQLPRGMPAIDIVQEELDFVPPHGVRYSILRTNEMDAYDPPSKSQKKRRSKS